jgi:VacB/RNase II family 3'-5' exoribonuclease
MSLPAAASRHELREIARRAMRARGLEPDFPAAARGEASSIPGPPHASASVRDLRASLWSSIDNDDTLDLDQLTVAEPGLDGAPRVLVAVADVDVLVPAGSGMDAHARVNTTSVYTAGAVFPMLPERLSTDLTSLREGEERLAVVVDMTVAADGSVTGAELYRALVLNRAKLAYNSVAAWLEGAGPAPARLAAVPGLAEALKLQDEIAQSLLTRRRAQGALALETREARPVFDGDTLVDLRPEEKNRAKALIEEFMVAANGAVARHLDAAGIPSVRRILRAPERWERIVRLASDRGESLPAEPDAAALQAFLEKRRRANPQGFAELSLAVVKLLGAGEYAVAAPGATSAAFGHFGLAMGQYAHSTAPNRRLVDLLTQRLLKAALGGAPPPYDAAQLAELAAHCSRQEDNAAKVERQVRKSAAALLLAPQVGRRFDGIVTGASAKGTWVRLGHPPVEGKIVRGAEGLDVGDRLTVELLHTDVEHGFIDFARVG